MLVDEQGLLLSGATKGVLIRLILDHDFSVDLATWSANQVPLIPPAFCELLNILPITPLSKGPTCSTHSSDSVFFQILPQ